MKPAHTLSALVLALAACGTLASPGGGDSQLPDNRTGPFRELTFEEMGERRCVLSDSDAQLDDPSAVRTPGGGIALYVTREFEGRRSVARATLATPGVASSSAAEVLAPSLSWHAGSVSQPSVAALPGGGWAMAFATDSGALGLARSDDGVSWRSQPAPALTGEPSAGEVTALRAPSLLVRADGTATLAYASAGALWFAEARTVDGPWTRVDADPRTPRRDAVLGATGHGSFVVDGGVAGFESGSLDDPSLLLEDTAAGRPLLRLYYTARSVPVPMDGGLAPGVAVSLAGSFDGRTFTRIGAPVLTSRTDPTLAAPSVLVDGQRRTVMYVSARCDTAGRRRGVRAAIAPGTERAPAPTRP